MNGDHFIVKLGQADVTDLSIEHLIIHANNATLGTIDPNAAEMVAGVSVGKNTRTRHPLS